MAHHMEDALSWVWEHIEALSNGKATKNVHAIFHFVLFVLAAESKLSGVKQQNKRRAQ